MGKIISWVIILGIGFAAMSCGFTPDMGLQDDSITKKTKLYEDVLKNFPDAKLKDVITNEEEEDR